MAEDKYKTFEIDGERYSIMKFPAKVGLNIARFVLSKGAPLLPLLREVKQNNNVEEIVDDDAIGVIIDVCNSITDAEQNDLIDKCLKVCYKILPAGLQAVMDSQGNFGVEGVEYNMVLMLKLCVAAVKWGASDFFSDTSLLSTLLGTTPNS